jgi:hypothetical protein
MKLFVLAALIAITQATTPVPRKTSDGSASAGNSIQSNPAHDKEKSTSPKPHDQCAAPQSDKQSTDGQRAENTEQSIRVTKLPSVTVDSPRRDWADWGMWTFNLLLAVTSGFQVWLLCKTLTFASRQTHEMKRQRIFMGGQLKTMAAQLAEMSVQSGILTDSVTVARDAANAAQDGATAAKESADAARDSVEVFISKERARLRIVVKNVDVESPKTVSFIKYSVQFYGNADAFISDAAAYAVINNSQIPNINDELAEIFKIALPDVIGPATTMTQEYTAHAYHGEGPLTFLLIDAINEAKMFVHFYAFIKYRTLDRERETRVCLTWNVNPAVNAMFPLGFKADHWEQSGPPEANMDT